MANLDATWRTYFDHTTDPYADSGAFYTPYQAVAAITSASILDNVESRMYPLPLLMANTDGHPILGFAPFTPRVLPGVVPAADKYVFAGEIAPNGALPALVELNAQVFHLTANADVLVPADMVAGWAAVPAGDQYLPVPAAGDNTENVRTRPTIPLPHRYVVEVLDQQIAGTLTLRWLWNHIGVPIAADPILSVDYSELLRFLQVQSTLRPPQAAGGVPREPEASTRVGVLTTPGLQSMALDVARGFLPGLNQATGLNAQMQQMQAGQTNLQQAILQGQQEREVTIETTNPLLANLLLKLCEVPTVNQLPAFWALNPRSKSTSWMSNLETTCLTIGNGLALPLQPPIISPSLVTDICTGRFVGFWTLLLVKNRSVRVKSP